MFELSSSSLLLSSLDLSDTKSMSLKYEPASEPLHISVDLAARGGGRWVGSGRASSSSLLSLQVLEP